MYRCSLVEFLYIERLGMEGQYFTRTYRSTNILVYLEVIFFTWTSESTDILVYLEIIEDK